MNVTWGRFELFFFKFKLKRGKRKKERKRSKRMGRNIHV
jgi:hypothetical protein